MRTKIISLLLLGALMLHAAAPEGTKEKLRKLCKLPIMSFGAGVSFDAEHGFSMFNEQLDAPAEIARLKKELTGGVEDAERYYRLGNHYAESGDRLNAKRSFDKAMELHRKKAELQPDDGRVQVEFGRALWAARKTSESENVFRQAVRVAPKESKCWVALGQFLDWKAQQTLAPVESRGESLEPDKLLATVLQTKPSPEQLTQSRKLVQEAEQCFDQAVAAAPQDPEAFVQRALHKSSMGYLEGIFGLLRGELKEPVEVMKGMFNPASIPDLREAARLSPTNYQAIATTAFFEALLYKFKNARAGQAEWDLWNDLPDSARKSIKEAMTQLEDLGQSNNPRHAAGALEGLALIQTLVVGDLPGGRSNLRRAVALDPGRAQSWDMLVAVLAQPESFEELKVVCEERIKKKDSARNRIILAKAHEKLNQYDKAERQVRVALAMEPGNALAHLSQAALLLRRSGSGGLAQAKNHLEKAQGALAKADKNKDSGQQAISLLLTSSIYYGLRDALDEARQLARQVLEREKDNQDAKEILSVLGP